MEQTQSHAPKRLKGIWILRKSLGMFFTVKSPLSLAVGVIGLPMAFLPLCLSKQLQRLTDLIYLLTPGHGGQIAPVLSALLLLGLLFMLRLIWQFLEGAVSIQDGYRTQGYMKETVLKHICTVHYSYLENRDDFFTKIAFVDTHACKEAVQGIQGMFDALYQLITFTTTGLALWAVHPVFVLVLIATGIPAAVLSYRQADETFRQRTKWSEEGHMAIHLYHLCTSTDHGIQEVRHYELFDYLKARWRAVADSYLHKKNHLVVKHVKANIGADFLRSSVYLMLLFVTVWMIYQNPALGLGTFTLVYTLSEQLQRAIGSIFTEIMQFSACLSYLKEFFALEDLERDEEKPLLQLEEGEKRGDAGSGDIVFDHVSFRYPQALREAVSDLSLTIRAGEKVAIVGDNGSGKSTFISLLTGMFSPKEGSITIGGRSMEKEKHELREKISVIFQDFAHYEAPLRENITVSDQERTCFDDEILSLARQIHVEDVILEQPQGLSGVLGHLSEKGNTLSGGQWQKIALLRAAYRSRADIMILDEPTAALDPLAEAQLYRDFSGLTGRRTTLLISHRLGITGLVDRILVFREGRIVEDGSHEELMARRGHYYKMYEAQAKWYQ